jgi:hypothetical protein
LVEADSLIVCAERCGNCSRRRDDAKWMSDPIDGEGSVMRDELAVWENE